MNGSKVIVVGLAAVVGVVALVFASAGGGAARRTSARQIATARAWAGLASLPSSAVQVSVSETGAFTWTAYYLRFSAPARDIDAFAAASPGLRGAKAEVFTPRHRLLPEPPRGQGLTGPPLTDNHDVYILLGVPGPSWFDRTVRKAGRRYSISYGGNYGEVVVNDASHTVYVYVADS